MVPVHTWLPDAAERGARPGTSVLLVSILDKIGTFGMIRFCLQLFPEASTWATPVVLVLAVISVLYGALAAIGQKSIPRLIAYTSVSHFGFIVLGIFVLNSYGQTGLDALHVQPRALDRRAVPGHRVPDQPPRVEADPRLRRRREGRAGAGRASSWSPGCRRCRCRACRRSSREFLVLLGAFTHNVVVRRRSRCSASCSPRSTSC